MTVRIFILVVTIVFLSSCAPYPVAYYQPESGDGTPYTTATCGLGPNDALSLAFDWGHVYLGLDKKRIPESFEDATFTTNLPSHYPVGASHLVLRVSFSVAEGRQVIVNERDLRVTIDSSDPRSYDFHSFHESVGQFLGKEPYRVWQRTYSDVHFADGSGYVLDDDGGVGHVWLDVNDADRIRIEQFAVEVNGKSELVGPVIFNKKLGVKMFTINC